MKRSPLKRGKPLRKVSARKKAQLSARAACLRIVRERSRGECEAGCTFDCTGAGRHGHEILPRSAGGDDTDPMNVLWVCRPCHDEIHRHPGEYLAAGRLLRSRYPGKRAPGKEGA